MASAEDYLQFGEMLLEGGHLNGKRLLSPKTVELMASVFVPDTVPGRSRGRGFGLSVQVVSDAVAAGYRVSTGSLDGTAPLGPISGWTPKRRLWGF